ncbi:MAG: TonB-dependent receptor [Maricaulaceae bacterium]
MRQTNQHPDSAYLFDGEATKLRWFLSASVAALGLAFAPMASAQEADTEEDASEEVAPEDIEVLTVTGFRQSVQNSVNTKRNLDIVAEVVSAEDIGRLPDISIADALARLPGVTAQRTSGLASALNIRGLNEDLVSADLNGREQVSTSGLRTIEFEQYPSELVFQAQVFKSPKAEQIEGGVAGRIELRTIRPLDFDERGLTINARGVFNTRADDSPDAQSFGYRVSGSYYDQFANDTLGFAVGYARLVQPNVNTRSVGFDFQPGETFPDEFFGNPVTNGGEPVLDFDADGNPDAVPFGFEQVVAGGEERRDAVLGVVQWEPSPRARFLFDGFYSRFDSEVLRRGVRLFGTQNIQSTFFVDNGDGTFTGTAPNADDLSEVQIANNAIIGGVFGPGPGIGVENVNQDDGDSDEIINLGLNAEFDVTDRLTVAFDVAYSRDDTVFNNEGITTTPGFIDADGNFNSIPVTVDFFRNGLAPISSDFNGFDFSDLSTNFLTGFFIVPNEDEDQLFSLRADVDYLLEWGPIESVEFGFRYTDREATNTVLSFSGSGPTFGSFGFNEPTPIPPELASMGDFSGDLAAAGAPPFTVLDIPGIFDALVGPTPVDQELGFTVDQSFSNFEDTVAGYVQFNLASSLFNVPYTGNVGVRVVNTSQSSPPAGTSFTQFLPSLNLSFEITENDVIRLAGSRQISRAPFDDLGGGVGIGVDPTGFVSGGGGNPTLLPFLTNQGEIIWEHYFRTEGLVALGFFYKQLQSFIIGGVDTAFDFEAAGFTLPPLPGNALPGAVIDPVGSLFGPINGEGGNVFGFEFQYTQPFTFLPGIWSNFGVILNYGYVESSISLPPSTLSGNEVDIPLPGQSTHVANPTLYYNQGGFDTRLNFSYRSSFVASQFGLNEQITGFDGELFVDYQASYEFDPSGPLGGLEVLFQVQNLLDTTNASFFGFVEQTATVQQFGRNIFLGFSYDF